MHLSHQAASIAEKKAKLDSCVQQLNCFLLVITCLIDDCLMMYLTMLDNTGRRATP
jgi:hypothetical protein